MPPSPPRAHPAGSTTDPAAAAPRALVLAAGLGTRLRPATDHLPKPLLPILGRPLLQEVCLALRAAGAGPLAVNTHHLADRIEAWARRARSGLDLTLFHEPRILGTGGALWNAREFLAAGPDFLLHNGDVLTDLDLPSLVGRHRRCGALATLALTPWPQADTVLLGPDGGIRDLAGRLGVGPGPGDRRLTYTGVAVLSREVLERLPAGPSCLVDALAGLLRDRPGSVRGWQPPRLYWNDLGTVERYLRAHADLLQDRRLRPPGARLPARPVFRGRGVRLPGSVTLEGFVSIGSRAEIGAGARLRDCVVLPDARVGAGERLARTLVGPGWRLPAASSPRERPASGGPAPPRPVRREDGRGGAQPPALLALPLVRAAGFGPRTRVRRLPGGSDRSFWRLADSPRTAVLALGEPRDPELADQLAIARWLAEQELGGPRLLAADPDRGAALYEDLGDATLEREVRAARDDPDRLRALYERALDRLVDLQTRGTGAAARCRAVAGREFGYEDLRWETGYFRQRLLTAAAGLPGERLLGLEECFHRLAVAVAAQPRVLMHRDFQSRNLILHQGRARIVDFQAMRPGPLAYDLASLLLDPYVCLPRRQRRLLLESYRFRLAMRGGPRLGEAALAEMLRLAGLQRLMQVLGAYAHLGLVRGKREFLAHVPAALALLAELLEDPRPPRRRAAGRAPRPDLAPLRGIVRELRRREPEAWRKGEVR